MNKDKRIILEFTPEEIKLMAYGVIPNDIKKRLTEIAYHIDDEKHVAVTHKESKRKQFAEKKYKCESCGRLINRLRCNLIAKK